MLMKKIYIAIAAILFAAASVATVLAVRSHNRMDDFFKANVDALVNSEDMHPENYVDCRHVKDYNYSLLLYIEVRDCWDCKVKKVSSVSSSNKCMP